MKKIQLVTSVLEYLPDELPCELAKLVEQAKLATQKAYAPYSKFNVGSAILLKNKKIVLGNNQENAAYPSGTCAERTAIFYANSKYPDTPVEAIAIASFTNDDFTNDPITPCGACRQVLCEAEVRFGTPITVVLYGKSKVYVVESVRSLMPLSFEKKSLLKVTE